MNYTIHLPTEKFIKGCFARDLLYVQKAYFQMNVCVLLSYLPHILSGPGAKYIILFSCMSQLNTSTVAIYCTVSHSHFVTWSCNSRTPRIHQLSLAIISFEKNLGTLNDWKDKGCHVPNITNYCDFCVWWLAVTRRLETATLGDEKNDNVNRTSFHTSRLLDIFQLALTFVKGNDLENN